MSADDAALWIDPGRRSGEPCMTGTRLHTSLVAEYLIVSEYTCDEFRADFFYDLTDRTILCAVWWQLTWDRHFDRRTKLGKWRDLAGQMLWHSDGPLPPLPPHVPDYRPREFP